VVALAAPASAREWIRARASGIEVLGDVGPGPTLEAAERLVRLRGALRQLFPGPEDPGRDLTLLLFGSRERFAGFIPRRHRRPDLVGGFFRGGEERDYAALHFLAGGARPFEAAEHEYAHLALNASLPAQPVWVAEGLAELLSDAVVDGGELRLGGPRPDYETLLAAEPSLPLEVLLTLGHDSPEYLGEARSDVLYAQCWALARWAVRRRGLSGLRAYLDTLAMGRDPLAAFVEKLGPLPAAEAGLRHMSGGRLFHVPLLEAPGAPARLEVPSEADVEHRLGDLLLQGGHTERARSHFERALASAPGHVPSRAGLVQLLLRTADWSGARAELEGALAAAPDDPVLLLLGARLRVREALARGVPLSTRAHEQVVAELESVASRAPQLHEAALLLASLQPEPYAHRIGLLQPLFEQQPERAEIAQVLSRLHVRNRDVTSARRILRRARAVATEPAYQFLFDRLLSRLGDFESATEEVEGRLVDLACRHDGSLRFTVETPSGTLQLAAPSTRSFFIRREGGPDDERQLLCGAQDLPLAVRYQRGAGPEPGSAGQVLWLSIREGLDEPASR
jgi:thioredoxin-like negative regulator of GroEL